MNVALIEFFVTDNKTFVFVIDPRKPGSNKEPWVAAIDIGEAELSSIKTMIRSFGRHPAIVERHITLFQNLCSRILSPAIEYIGSCDILYIIPHKDLHYLPLHAVEIDGQPLCDKYAIVYLPNASLLKFCQANNVLRKKKHYSYNKILTMGIGAREELDHIRKKFVLEAEMVQDLLHPEQGHLFSGIRATKTAFMDFAIECDLIHIASHGYFNQFRPLGSGPLLAYRRRYPQIQNDSVDERHVLMAEEFYQLRLNANLIVFSGCFTGLSDVRPGDELMGLIRGVFAAGITSMVLCLWQAYHDATILFMEHFYRELIQGTPKAIAFQFAQNKLRHHPQFSHLRYWAPFVLIGDWL